MMLSLAWKTLALLCERLPLLRYDLSADSYSSNYNLGNTYIAMGLLDEAFTSHKLVLPVRRENLGENYQTAASLHKVA